LTGTKELLVFSGALEDDDDDDEEEDLDEEEELPV